MDLGDGQSQHEQSTHQNLKFCSHFLSSKLNLNYSLKRIEAEKPLLFPPEDRPEMLPSTTPPPQTFTQQEANTISARGKLLVLPKKSVER